MKTNKSITNVQRATSLARLNIEILISKIYLVKYCSELDLY